jgi:hypothetical protein
MEGLFIRVLLGFIQILANQSCHIEQMVTIAPIFIRVIELLGKRNKFTQAMFCSVVAGKKFKFFFAKKPKMSVVLGSGDFGMVKKV